MQVSSEMSTATAPEGERPDSRAGRPQSIDDLQTNTFAGAQNRVVAKAEEYNTKKPELVGYEELKQVVAYTARCKHTSAYVSIRQHASAYVSTRQHTSACVRTWLEIQWFASIASQVDPTVLAGVEKTLLAATLLAGGQNKPRSAVLGPLICLRTRKAQEK